LGCGLGCGPWSPAELARISASRDGGPWWRDGRQLGEVNGRRLCVTWPRRLPAEPAIAAAAAALIEHGDSFSITASYGVIVLPHDSRDAAAALAHRRLRWRHVDPACDVDPAAREQRRLDLRELAMPGRKHVPARAIRRC
jgi:hypothetical protein